MGDGVILFEKSFFSRPTLLLSRTVMALDWTVIENDCPFLGVHYNTTNSM